MKIYALPMILVGLMAQNALAQEKTVIITTLDYMPYISEKNPEDGVGSLILRKAFAAKGYTVKFEFYPWARAKQKAALPGYAGYWPAYPSDIEPGFTASDNTVTARVVLMELPGANNTIKSLADLKGKKLGLVREYSYGEDIDRMVTNKEIIADEASDEKSMILKLVAGRHPLAITDLLFTSYLYATDRDLRLDKNKISVVKDFKIDFDNVIYFQDTAEGKKYRDDFNAGMKSIDSKKIIEEYFKAANIDILK